MSTALIYVRQSRHKDYERTVSPEVQETSCRALPPVQGCDDVEVFVDLDKSGKSIAQRPEFGRFLARIESESPAVVAVYDQSRSFRNTTEALDFYALMERLRQVQVVFVHGSFDRSAVGEFSYTALAAAHTMERRMTGEKIRDAKRYAASKGEMIGAVPAGYRWQGTGRDRVLVIEEEVSAIVRRVFAEYATGRWSTRDIARRLNSEGVVLPRFTGGWRADTVAQLLTNPVYIGMTYVNRRHREGALIPGRWPALIDMETWTAVQALVERRRLAGGGGNKPVSERRAYVFGGLLRCMRCARRMHCHSIKDRLYYQCRGNDRAEPCRKGVREDQLTPWIEGLFTILDRFRPAALAEHVRDQRETGQPGVSQGALAQLDATIARLGKRFEWGHIDEATYLGEHARLTAQRQELMTTAEEPATVSLLPLGSLMDGWRTEDPRVRHDLVAAFFDELDVRDGEIVSVVPRSEYAAEVVALLELAEKERRCSPGGIRGNYQLSPETVPELRFA